MCSLKEVLFTGASAYSVLVGMLHLSLTKPVLFVFLNVHYSLILLLYMNIYGIMCIIILVYLCVCCCLVIVFTCSWNLMS